MFNSHNFDSDWDYYDWLEGADESCEETEEEDYDPEDEQEVDGVGDRR